MQLKAWFVTTSFVACAFTGSACSPGSDGDGDGSDTGGQGMDSGGTPGDGDGTGGTNDPATGGSSTGGSTGQWIDSDFDTALAEAKSRCEAGQIKMRLNSDASVSEGGKIIGRKIDGFDVTSAGADAQVATTFTYLSQPGSVEFSWPSSAAPSELTDVSGRILNIEGDYCFTGRGMMGEEVDGAVVYYFVADQFSPTNGDGSCDGVVPSTQALTAACVTE